MRTAAWRLFCSATSRRRAKERQAPAQRFPFRRLGEAERGVARSPVRSGRAHSPRLLLRPAAAM